MAQRIIVQDGNILYATSDPVDSVKFTVAGQFNVTKEINVGDDPLAAGSISTPTGSSVDLIISTNTDGLLNGNIRLAPVSGGSIILNNVIWPDGTVSPTPGMYLGVSALNTLQFYNLPVGSIPAYDSAVATASQTVFNTAVSTVANSGGFAHLQVFVNGVKQMEGATKNYQVTGPNQITFNTGLSLNDDVEFYAFS
jgi:hypothetical protein